MPVPLSGSVCTAPTTFRLLSAIVTASVSGLPGTVGAKFTPMVHAPLIARVVLELHVDEPLSEKFADAVARPLSTSEALPSLVSVTVCGLSLLVEPSLVVAKLSGAGVALVSCWMELVPRSATRTLPLGSSATKAGCTKEPRVVGVYVPAANSSTSALPIAAT